MYYSKFDSPLYMIMTVVNATDINRTNLPIKKRKWSARTLFVLGMLVLVSFAALATNPIVQTDAIKAPLLPKPLSLVQKFYILNKEKLYWFSSPERANRAGEWLAEIITAEKDGIIPNHLHIGKLRAELDNKKIVEDSLYRMRFDWQISALILTYIRTLQQGNIRFKYDEISVSHDSVYCDELLNMKTSESVVQMVKRLECKDSTYQVLRNFLRDSISITDSIKYRTVQLAMNYRRYLSFNHQPEYILVNIPEMEAGYYRNDSLKVRMRTVVGKILTPTPVMASYITDVVTFPNWNVPRSIAVNEILPKVKRNANYLEQHSLEVVDSKGAVIEDADLKWKSYTARNFPYFFRQSTGAGNALGVLKFNMHNPFSIFLHATSSQSAFAKTDRFLSHGCIRLQKPFELAKNLLRGEIDMEQLRQGKTNTKTKRLKPVRKIATFIIYMPLKVKGNSVVFLPDPYQLIK